MLLSFKTSVTDKKVFQIHAGQLSVVQQLLSYITRFFAGHYPTSGANILGTCILGTSVIKESIRILFVSIKNGVKSKTI